MSVVVELSQSGPLYFAKNDLLATVKATAPAGAEEYAVCYTICLDGEDLFDPVKLKFDDDGCDSFGLDRILRECLSDDCPTLASNDLVDVRFVQHQNSYKEFQYKITESYVLNGNPISQTTPATICVVNGGVNDKYMSPSEMNSRIANGQHLSWFPGTQNLSTAQPAYLSFFVPLGVTTVGYQAIVNTVNGLQTISLGSNAVEKGVWSVATGYCHMGLSIDPADIIDYEIQVVDDLGNTLATRTYCLECHEEHWSYFLFQNSLGGIETLHFKGARREQLDPQASLAQNYRTLKPFNRRIASGYSVNTGQIFNKDQMWFFHDLFSSEFVKEIVFCKEACECPDLEKALYCAVFFPPAAFTTEQSFEYKTERAIAVQRLNEEVVCTPVTCPCRDIVMLKCELEEIKKDCCPEIDLSGVLFYTYRQGNNWYIWSNVGNIAQQLTAAGVTNVTVLQELNCISGTNNGIIGTTSATTLVMFRRILFNTCSQISRKVTFTGDIECEGEIHSFTITMQQGFSAPTANQSWVQQPINAAAFSCIDNDARFELCIKLESCDELFGDSAITSQQNEYSFNGVDWLPAVSPICFPEPFPTRIVLRRTIETTGCDFPLVFEKLIELCPEIEVSLAYSCAPGNIIKATPVISDMTGVINIIQRVNDNNTGFVDGDTANVLPCGIDVMSGTGFGTIEIREYTVNNTGANQYELKYLFEMPIGNTLLQVLQNFYNQCTGDIFNIPINQLSVAPGPFRMNTITSFVVTTASICIEFDLNQTYQKPCKEIKLKFDEDLLAILQLGGQSNQEGNLGRFGFACANMVENTYGFVLVVQRIGCPDIIVFDCIEASTNNCDYVITPVQ